MMDIEVQFVQFNEEGIEVTYQEKRDSAEGVVLLRTIIIDRSVAQAEIEDAMDTMQDVVDKALNILTGQPESFQRDR